MLLLRRSVPNDKQNGSRRGGHISRDVSLSPPHSELLTASTSSILGAEKKRFSRLSFPSFADATENNNRRNFFSIFYHSLCPRGKFRGSRNPPPLRPDPLAVWQDENLLTTCGLFCRGRRKGRILTAIKGDSLLPITAIAMCMYFSLSLYKLLFPKKIFLRLPG